MRPLLAAALLALPLAAAAAPRRAFDVAPPPAWVAPVPADLAAPPHAEASGGTDYLVADDQVRVTAAGPEKFHRVVQRVLSESGISDAAELSVDYDPTYERVTLHAVTIVRGGRRIDALRPSEVKVLQRERELEMRLFDGSSSLVLFLHDVRVGDVVESSYTVRGANPVFAGKFAGGFSLAYSVPVGRIRARLLWPADRPLAWRAHGAALEPAVARRGGEVEYRWARDDVAPVPDEGDLPPGFDAWPWIQLSEYRSWAEVVEWALPLYAAAPPSRAMEERLAAWRALPTAEARARAALRFVQDEVRYLGIELGQSSHRPHAPAEVFARRFGDCKDKTLLTVSLLRALGVAAAPALVHTDDAAAVEGRLPSPFAFDHVIVRATLDGAVHWLDPTRSLERGPIPSREAPTFGRALVIAPGEASLQEIPPPEPPLLDVTSTWTVARFGEPATLVIVTRLAGTRAVSMRHLLADTPRAELEKRYLDHYAHVEPGIALARPLAVEDAADEDRMVLTETYRVPAIAAGEEKDFWAEAVGNVVKDPQTALRKLPLGIAHPVHVREELRVHLPGPATVAPEGRTVSTATARLTRTADVRGPVVSVTFDYRSLADRTPPERVAEHLRALRAMRDLAGFRIALAVEDAPVAAWGGAEVASAATFVAASLGALLVVLHSATGGGWIGGWRQRRRRRAFDARFRAAPGDSAEVPLLVRDVPEALARVARGRCACGGGLGPAAVTDRLAHGGREVLVVQAPCTRCAGGGARAYVTIW